VLSHPATLTESDRRESDRIKSVGVTPRGALHRLCRKGERGEDKRGCGCISYAHSVVCDGIKGAVGWMWGSRRVSGIGAAAGATQGEGEG
jgi:hypothetical protein